MRVAVRRRTKATVRRVVRLPETKMRQVVGMQRHPLAVVDLVALVLDLTLPTNLLVLDNL